MASRFVPRCLACLLALTAPSASAQVKASRLAAATPTPTPPPGAFASAAGALSVFGPPAHSPDRLDFAPVWDGESSPQTFSFTAAAKGYVRVEIPPGPFSVTQIRELGPPKAGGSKNSGFGSQPMISQETKGKVDFPEGIPGPWTYGADAGNQVLVHVVFKPKFDISNMMAGPKSATMKVSGPGHAGAWTLAVPLAGTFNGRHSTPLLILPKKDFWQPSVAGTGYEEVPLVVRLVGAGEAVSGRIVFPSLAPGLKASPRENIKLGPTQTLEVTVYVNGTGGHGDTTPLDGKVAFEFTRKGEGGSQQTPPVDFRVVFFPGDFDKQMPTITCNGVLLEKFPHVSARADGTAGLSVLIGPCQYKLGGHDVSFEVFFKGANRTLFQTYVPCNGHPIVQTKVEEGSPPTICQINQAWNVLCDGKIGLGDGTLDRYRALLRSGAEVRCR